MRRISSLKEYEGLETRVMCEDRQGGYWVRTNRGIDRVTFVKEPLKNTKFSNFGEEVVRAFHQDRSGRVWIADKNGFVRIVDRNLGNVRYLSADGRITPAAAVFGHNVYCIYEDRHGQIWLGTKPAGCSGCAEKGRDGCSTAMSAAAESLLALTAILCMPWLRTDTDACG